MIYEDPARYAEAVNISIDRAENVCGLFVELYRLRHALSKCPKCGENTLVVETGEFDELTNTTLNDEYVTCTNDSALVSEEVVSASGDIVIETYEDFCDFESDDLEKYDILGDWVDFDELLYTTYLDMTEEERNIIADRVENSIKQVLEVHTNK